MPRFQAKFIVTLQSERVANLGWVQRRFKNWLEIEHTGFKASVTIEPEWEEIADEGS